MSHPLQLHLPHASTVIPSDRLQDYIVNSADLAREQLRLTDWFTDELYATGWPERDLWRAPVSRLVVDVERHRADDAEPCARVGMGAVYERGTQGQVLRTPSPALRELLLKTYYDPHHARCAAQTAAVLATARRCVILDAHSYPSVALPTEPAGVTRPEIGLGLDGFHTPPALAAESLAFFQARGLEVGLNTPYQGSFVPTVYWGSEPRVETIMVEVRRDLYLNEATGTKSPGFLKIQQVLTDYRTLLAAYAQR